MKRSQVDFKLSISYPFWSQYILLHHLSPALILRDPGWRTLGLACHLLALFHHCSVGKQPDLYKNTEHIVRPCLTVMPPALGHLIYSAMDSSTSSARGKKKKKKLAVLWFPLSKEISQVSSMQVRIKCLLVEFTALADLENDIETDLRTFSDTQLKWFSTSAQ